MSDKKVRKNTKGIPRVTDKVIAMSDADRAKWFAEKCAKLNEAQKNEVQKRLETALSEGRKPKKVNFVILFSGRTVAELKQASAALTVAMANAEKAEVETLNRIIAKAEAQKKILEDAAKEKAATAATV
jgi:hypothetical protein